MTAHPCRSFPHDYPVPLYQPLNTLKPVAENIWIADGDLT